MAKVEMIFAERKWDNAPGGRVIMEYTDPSTRRKYVVVEFKKSPGKQYTYYA